MPPIDFGPAGAIRAAGPIRATAPVSGVATSPRAASEPVAAAAVQKSAALDPGSPPIDTNRVSQIRTAIANGTYPLMPTKIADGMIAAGIILSTPK